ncbi:MAG TPA: ChbG/HpnK family deacetylase [Thermomicrobiales bacterium]|jgi:predicted glycoside hydrolase/deacetylase ChbG (UPF0249 family)
MQHDQHLVINGDDFGYSEAINEAIIRCHANGTLTSATLLVNQPATHAAIRLAHDCPNLGVGWHVNLTEGGPVLPPREVPTLTDRRGQFRPIGAQLGGLLSGRTSAVEVERELRAQLAILLDAGLRPTHVDGHLHAHAFPRVFPIVLRIMAEHGIGALRSPAIGAWLPPQRVGATVQNPFGALKPGSPLTPLLTSPRLLGLLAWLTPRLERARLRQLRQAGIVYADRLFDATRFLAAPDPPTALATAITAGSGLTEIMAHPAWNRDATRGAAEIALLTDPRLRAALDERGVRRVYYGEWTAER